MKKKMFLRNNKGRKYFCTNILFFTHYSPRTRIPCIARGVDTQDIINIQDSRTDILYFTQILAFPGILYTVGRTTNWATASSNIENIDNTDSSSINVSLKTPSLQLPRTQVLRYFEIKKYRLLSAVIDPTGIYILLNILILQQFAFCIFQTYRSPFATIKRWTYGQEWWEKTIFTAVPRTSY